MALIKCPECGGKVSDKAKACPSCGMPVEEILISRKCPECGNIIQDKAMFCTNCGFPLNENTEDNKSYSENTLSNIENAIEETDEQHEEYYDTENDSVLITEPQYSEMNTGYYKPKMNTQAIKLNFNNVWFGLLTIVVPALGLILTLCDMGNLAIIIIMALFSAALIWKDDSELRKNGTNVKPVWRDLGYIFLVPFYVFARAIKTKFYVPMVVYVVFIVLDVMAMFGYISFSDSGDFLNYLNVQMKDSGEIEDKMVNYYNNYVVGHSLSDANVYHYISDILIPYADELSETALKVQKNIKNSKVKELHNIYIQYCDAWMGMLTSYQKYVDYSDRSYYNKGQEYCDKMAELYEKYMAKINELAQEYDVTLYER